ncbi:MAG: copper chaperone PCu(A)C [Betaproteobacteria bacterium]
MRTGRASALRMLRAGTGVLAVVACTCALAQIRVDNAWVRGAVPGQLSTGAFLDLTSARDVKLIKVESPIAAVVEVHQSEMKNDMMTMHAVPSVALPAGKQVRFAPGGYHIMLMDLKQPVKNGESVPIKLTLEYPDKKRETVEVSAQVRGLGTSQQSHQH